MKNIFVCLDENYILFENTIINVIIDNTDKLWFNSGQLTKAIGYINYIKAIKQHTKTTDRIQLKYINHSYNIKQHPQTIYLSENGMYKLMLKSKMKKAQIFADWITNIGIFADWNTGKSERKESQEAEASRKAGPRKLAGKVLEQLSR